MPPAEEVRFGSPANLPRTAERYLLVAGYLAGGRIDELDEDELARTWEVNFAHAAQAITEIMASNERARICVISSESGISGSFDMAYAGAKAAMNLFVETTRLRYPRQQLVGIAPSIVSDAGMTTRRTDLHILGRRLQHHPKKRFASSLEVALLAHTLLYGSDFISGVVIRMNGGEHATR